MNYKLNKEVVTAIVFLGKALKMAEDDKDETTYKEIGETILSLNRLIKPKPIWQDVPGGGKYYGG